MQIPKQFELAGQTIRVVFENQMISDRDVTGQARFRVNEIAIQPSSESRIIPDDHINTTFYHELIHRILYLMQNDMGSDEKFVQMFADFLYQYEKTKVL